MYSLIKNFKWLNVWNLEYNMQKLNNVLKWKYRKKRLLQMMHISIYSHEYSVKRAYI